MAYTGLFPGTVCFVIVVVVVDDMLREVDWWPAAASALESILE